VTEYFIILADSELELIPNEILRERCILNNARARGKAPERILLDASHHHPAFGKLPDSERRGRPDIVHFFLMLCMDSDLSAEGKLRVFVHTRNNDVIAVNPQTRLPPHYPRFVGLIETLYEQRVVPSRENALLELRDNVSLDMLVNALKPDKVVVLDSTGEAVPLADKFASLKADRVVIVIGGFSKGTYRSDLNKLGKPIKVSLGERMLKVWTVTSKVLCAIEHSKDVVVVKTEEPSKPRRARKKTAA
jgi:rRNA small subunit pseudouridine methyltransferase Nep1